ENEVNGLLTYDRQVVKVDTARVRAANQALVQASENPAPPVTLPTGLYRSLRVTTPGHTDKYVRHYDQLAFTAVVDGSSPAVLKSDATWKVVTGLANGSCYSFESRNYPGEYLRHKDFRVRRDANDGSALFKADATWCAVAGSGGVRLTSANLPGSYLRHIGSEVWLATPGGTHAWDQQALFTEDTTWAVDAPWAP
ncbi:AbfB domain-containing protein, partial [Streptomyces flavovirens]